MLALLAMLVVCGMVAALFHWLAMNDDRTDVRSVRAYYRGDPLLNAIILDGVFLVLVVVIVLRAQGIDVVALLREAVSP